MTRAPRHARRALATAGAGAWRGVCALVGDDARRRFIDDDARGVLGDVRLVRDQHDRDARRARAPGTAPSPRRWSRESRLPVGSSARITFGCVDERARDRDALLLAARELVRVVIERARRGRPARAPRARAAWRSRAGDARVEQRQLDVLERARARQQVEALEHEAERLGCGPRRARRESSRDDVAPVEQVVARASADRGSRGCSSASTCPSPTRP